MKIRQAKKIMKHQPCNDLSYYKTSLYWLCAWNRYNNYLHPSSLGSGKADSRIIKAINLSAKYKARNILHSVEKEARRTPFTLKDMEAYKRKLDNYKV